MNNNITRELLYGKCPIKRLEPQQGESQWYYFDPRGTDLFSEMKTIDVPTKDTPNPRDEEIRQYLYQNDNYNYRMLYGDNPPTTTNSANIEIDASSMADDEKNNVDYSLYGDGFSQEFIDQMLKDERFKRAMNKTKFNEGGYANHPNDFGGETNYGISSRFYPNEDILNMTPERAKAILYRDYWLQPKIHLLPDEFADIVFDDGVVQGQPTAIQNIQRALGVQVDGIIGSETLNAFDDVDYDVVKKIFINNVNRVEDKYLQNNPSQRVFEKGHRSRFGRY